MDDILKELEGLTNEIVKIIAPDTLDDIFESEKPYDDEVSHVYNQLIAAIEECLYDEKISEGQLLNHLSSTFHFDEFWSCVKESVDIKMEPFKDTAFLREFTEKKQVEIIQWIFANGMLVQETHDFLGEHLGLSEEKVEIVLRVLRMAQGFAINKGYSRRLFFCSMKGLFKLEEAVCEIIWEMLQTNKKELEIRAIFQKLEDVEYSQKTMEQLFDISQSLLGDDEF